MSTEQRIRIAHTDASSVTRDVTEAVEFNDDEGIKTTVDSFDFRVLMGASIATFAVNDLVKIYLDEGSATPTSLVMDGLITEIQYSYDVDAPFISVKGINRLERLLNSTQPLHAEPSFNYSAADAQDGTARNGVAGIIAHMIDWANRYKGADGTDITYDTDSLPAVTTSGGAWPNLPEAYYKDWMSIFEHIETLSSNEWTQDGHYIFWLDTDNKFYWQPLNSATYNDSVSEIVLEGSDVINFSATHSVFDVINAIIMNCGKDKNSNTIHTMDYDITSMGLYGMKWSYQMKEEIANQHISQNPGDSNDTVRARVKAKAKIIINNILKLYGNPRWKLDLGMQGNTTFVKGKTYTFRSTELGWTGANTRKLRLMNIKHSFNSNGWTTDYNYEEDDKTLESV